MRIAWLTPEIPYPPIGGRNGVYNRIVQLSKYNDIYLFSIAYSDEEKTQDIKMRPYCKEVHYYNRNESKGKTLIKSIFAPYSVASRTVPELKKDLQAVIDRCEIDIIIVDFPNMAKNIVGLQFKGYCTLNQHNNEYRRMRDMFFIKSISKIKRLAYFLESFRLEQYEKKIYEKGLFSSITFFSTDDFNEFKRKWKNSSAELKIFPLGANKVAKEIENKDLDHNTMLFVGRLDEIATTNVEAILWFCKEVFPLVKKDVDAKLIIAGANPCDAIKKQQSKDIRVIPNYSKLEDVYSEASIVILPLLSGGGVKGKLLEASAFGKIIVSTYHGVEGTQYQKGRHFLLGEDANTFAKKCVWAINNIDAATEIAISSRVLFEREYEWTQIGINYNSFLEKRVKGDA